MFYIYIYIYIYTCVYVCVCVSMCRCAWRGLLLVSNMEAPLNQVSLSSFLQCDGLIPRTFSKKRTLDNLLELVGNDSQIPSVASLACWHVEPGTFWSISSYFGQCAFGAWKRACLHIKVPLLFFVGDTARAKGEDVKRCPCCDRQRAEAGGWQKPRTH